MKVLIQIILLQMVFHLVQQLLRARNKDLIHQLVHLKFPTIFFIFFKNFDNFWNFMKFLIWWIFDLNLTINCFSFFIFHYFYFLWWIVYFIFWQNYDNLQCESICFIFIHFIVSMKEWNENDWIDSYCKRIIKKVKWK